VSCTNVNFEEYIEKDKPFYLIQHASPTNSLDSKTYTIAPNTPKHKKLLDWLNENQGT
jgi:hypothetical protein